jgi:hypothetical protein
MPTQFSQKDIATWKYAYKIKFTIASNLKYALYSTYFLYLCISESTVVSELWSWFAKFSSLHIQIIF